MLTRAFAWVTKRPLRVALASLLATWAALLMWHAPAITGHRSDLVNNKPAPSASQEANSGHLVVMFHGLSGARLMTDVRAAVARTFPASDILAPEFPASILSNEDPLKIVQAFLSAIDDAVRRRRYDRITFVGFSLGAPLARKVAVCAATGCSGDYGGREGIRPWFGAIDRMVLLAGMNRGWATSCEPVVAVVAANGSGFGNDCRAPYLSWRKWLAAEAGQRFAPAFGLGRLLMEIRRGEPFIANLRLEWLALERTQRTPAVIQLVGDTDDVVSRDDQVDSALTSRFVFIPVDDTTHEAIVDFSDEVGAERATRFIDALREPVEDLKARFPEQPAPVFEIDAATRRVVIILHGIRDDGYWARELGDLFEAEPGTKTFYRSYGYFSALHFLMPHRMNANVRWFVDQYTELRAAYPLAAFDFVGHSNGTFIAAKALQRYHQVTFRRLAFAGSVVQIGFDWTALSNLGRLDAIRNYRASNDIVVAALPSFFEKIGRFLEVGGAGHAGFTDGFARRFESRYFATGGHGAALGNVGGFEAIRNFILGHAACDAKTECEDYELPPQSRTESQTAVATLLYKYCVYLWLGLFALFGTASYAVSRAVRPNRPPRTKWEYSVRSAIASALLLASIGTFLRFY